MTKIILTHELLEQKIGHCSEIYQNLIFLASSAPNFPQLFEAKNLPKSILSEVLSELERLLRKSA